MKAAVYRGPGRITVEEVTLPQITSESVLLRVEACGICGSDLRTYRHGMRFECDWQILGHEVAGVVAETGRSVTEYRTGDRLAVAADIHCGRCYYCRRALYNLCDDWKLLGAHYAGGLAEYMLLSRDILERGIIHRIPEGLSTIHAALAEPASSVIAGLQQAGVEPSEVVVILGDGPIGWLHVQVVQARGGKAILVGHHAERLEGWQERGAWRIIDNSREPVVDTVLSLTDGLGADVAVAACASREAQDDAVRMVRKRGRVVLFGGLPASDPVTHLDSNLIHYRELRLLGAFSYHPSVHATALDLIARGLIRADQIISATYPLERIGDAFDALLARREMKVIVTPTP